MERHKVCTNCISRIEGKHTEELAEAHRIYQILQSITDSGCDAEVKKVKGSLKILSVKKSVATESYTIN